VRFGGAPGFVTKDGDYLVAAVLVDAVHVAVPFGPSNERENILTRATRLTAATVPVAVTLAHDRRPLARA
jgi:hypothetical protein